MISEQDFKIAAGIQDFKTDFRIYARFQLRFTDLTVIYEGFPRKCTRFHIMADPTGGIQLGAPVSKRAHKVGGAMRNLAAASTLRAQSGCANHRKFNGRSSLRGLPGFSAAEYHILVYYYTANWRRCTDISPYCFSKFCGGFAPPPPPNKIVLPTLG